MFERKKKIEKEYTKEYCKVCDNITCDDIIDKEIFLTYDEEIIDLSIKIPIEDNKYVNEVNYEIYSNRLKNVKVLYPNGDIEYYEISGSKYHNVRKDICSISWEEPTIKIKYRGIIADVSIVSLIENGAKAYINNYDLKGIDFGE